MTSLLVEVVSVGYLCLESCYNLKVDHIACDNLKSKNIWLACFPLHYSFNFALKKYYCLLEFSIAVLQKLNVVFKR